MAKFLFQAEPIWDWGWHLINEVSNPVLLWNEVFAQDRMQSWIKSVLAFFTWVCCENCFICVALGISHGFKRFWCFSYLCWRVQHTKHILYFLQFKIDADAYGQAASNLVAGNNLDHVIQEIIDMGGGSWDRDTVVRALCAAYNNPKRAVEYLYFVRIFICPNLTWYVIVLPIKSFHFLICYMLYWFRAFQRQQK